MFIRRAIFLFVFFIFSVVRLTTHVHVLHQMVMRTSCSMRTRKRMKGTFLQDKVDLDAIISR